MAAFETANLRLEQRLDGVAILRMDVAGHSVNVLNGQLLADLDETFDYVSADSAAKILVIRGDKPSGFLAGADLHDFATITTAAEAEALSALGQKLFSKLHDLRIPTIALIHGPCLGGGLELALACDYRMVADHSKTQLGLPEVELGLLPAWGGTQRLPRVVGLERALRVMLGGKRLRALEALRWGLADAMGATEAELSARLQLLIERARSDGKRPNSELPLHGWRQRFFESTPIGRSLVFRGTERVLRRRVPDDMPAPWEALQAVRTGLRHGLEAGLKYEREAAGRLATSNACRNLISLFLAREEARKPPETASKIRRVAVIGAGTMGAGIAQLASIHEFELVIREVNDAALKAGMERIAGLLDKAVENKVLTREAAERKLAAIQGVTGWNQGAAAWDAVDLVVEAIIEDLPLKQRVFREVEEHTRRDTILATNTSSLLVQQIQDSVKQRERVAGLHFFNPVHKMHLVEVAHAPRTSGSVVASLVKWVIALGKTPIVVKDSPGFVVNRILMPYLYEAVLLVSQGMQANAIDSTMRRFGMPMGPLELLDQVGLDVAAHSARSMQALFRDRLGTEQELSGLALAFEAFVKRGWLGQKAGLGIYRYKGNAKKVHPQALEILRKEPKPAGELIRSLPKEVQMQEARERMVLLMVNEAALCLAEALAPAAQIDLAMVLGTGWAPHRGGPLHYADARGLTEAVQKLKELSQRAGPRFQPCAELQHRAMANESFYP
jgi:3-hydroxyacyl-CoA dehydrogenase/enoyl-CoA hydratase/3-hydroxybutyryl-CoA epimerase